MSDNVTYRWIEGPEASPEDWAHIENIMSARGWMSLSRVWTRVLMAEDMDKKLVGFVCLQAIPHTGPLWVAPSMRGTDVAKSLADQIINFMYESEARGWFAIASNSIVAKMCEEHGMVKIDHPVYVAGGA